jgi:hypothetical protein
MIDWEAKMKTNWLEENETVLGDWPPASGAVVCMVEI